MNFQQTDVAKEIANELSIIGMLDAKFKMCCTENSVTTFCNEKNGILHEIMIQTASLLSSKETARDLLNVKDIGFFSHKVFVNEELAGQRIFRKGYAQNHN